MDWIYFIVEVVEQKAMQCNKGPFPPQKEERKKSEAQSHYFYILYWFEEKKEHHGQRRTLRTTGSDPQLTTNFW